jgi:methyl-accepting chemotaxis protein
MIMQKIILAPVLFQVTMEGLLIFLASALVLVIGILLITILWNVRKMTAIMRSVLEKNQDEIHRTVQSIPNIVENVEQITGNVSETTDTFNASFPEILEDTASITHSAKEAVETANSVIESLGCGVVDTVTSYKKHESSFMPYVHIFEEVLQIVLRVFAPKKKK